MKKNIKALFLTALVFFGIFMIIGNSFAADFKYSLLEKIPGFELDGSNFTAYITSIYKFAVWTVGIAATLMLGIGGFMYFTSAGNTSHLEKAKTVIKDSIIGVVVTLTAYLLLLVINPNLVGGDISSSNATALQGNNSTSGFNVPVNPIWPPDPALGTLPAGTVTHLEAEARLNAVGSAVAGPLCVAGDLMVGACVSLDGIPEEVVVGLEVAGQAGFVLNVTGGTEWWTHGTTNAGCPNPVTAADLPLPDACTGLHGPDKPGVDIDIPVVCPFPYDCTPLCDPLPAYCPTVLEKKMAAVMDATGASGVLCADAVGNEPVSCFMPGITKFHLSF